MASNSNNVTPPYTSAVEVVLDDNNDLDAVSRAIIIEGSGSHHDVVVTMQNDADGTSVTLHCAKGVVIPVRVKRVWATGTTATDVVALY